MQSNIIDEKLISEVKSSINDRNSKYLSKLIDNLRPADLADLIEHLKQEERIYLFEMLEPEGAGEVLIEIEAPIQESIIHDLDNKAITEIVQELDSDDAADLVGDLPAERAKDIIETLDDTVSDDLEKLLPYDEDSAGGIMALEYVAVKDHCTIREAIEIIKSKREEVENLYYLWVVDDFGKLVGVVSMKDLILEPSERLIREIMNTEIISVDVNRDQEEVAQLFKKYDLVAIPVVDEYNRLVGRITHDDIIDVLEEETDEDISLMAGVMHQEITEDSYIKISKARLPWLIAGLFGGLLAAAVINRFEHSIEKLIALAFFFPVIMAMGGNTGTQASTVAVRGLATGDISLVDVWKRLWVEMKVAMANGLICGVLLGIVVYFWVGNIGLGLVIAVSLMMIIIISGFIGAAVPLVLKRINIDPALATGPFVTTTNDILSLLIYLGLVTVFLKLA
ncbi:MAG: magnesium transporter [Desulfatiglans sp.]|jgi:magnesium transporter|nr:magnesium transporter [Desulfatiglans sp.]